MVVGTERLTEVQKILKQVEYESACRKRHISYLFSIPEFGIQGLIPVSIPVFPGIWVLPNKKSDFDQEIPKLNFSQIFGVFRRWLKN